MNALGKMAVVLLITLLPGLASALATKGVLTASLSGPSTNAAGLTGFELWIETTTLNVPDGETITSPLEYGGLTIAFDPNVLTFQAFVFAPNVAGNYTLSENPLLCGSTLSGCGSIDIWPLPGGTPYATEVDEGLFFGTFLFDYLGGSSLLELGPDGTSPLYFSLNGAQTYEEKNFVNASVVPLPLAAWLMLSGLGMLGAFGFRKSG